MENLEDAMELFALARQKPETLMVYTRHMTQKTDDWDENTYGM